MSRLTNRIARAQARDRALGEEPAAEFKAPALGRGFVRRADRRLLRVQRIGGESKAPNALVIDTIGTGPLDDQLQIPCSRPEGNRRTSVSAATTIKVHPAQTPKGESHVHRRLSRSLRPFQR